MALRIQDLCDSPEGASVSDVYLPGMNAAPVILSVDQQRALSVVRSADAGALVPPRTPMDSGLQFVEVTIALSDLASGGSVEFKQAGVELVFSQVGSSPGALVKLKAGGTLSTLAPGCRMAQPFEGFTLQAATGCATSGTARFIVVKNLGYNYQEPVTIAPGNQLTTLLGTVASDGSLEFVSVVPDTNPSGESPSGSFDVSGFRAIDVYCDLGAANRFATVNVWFKPRGSTQWFLNQSAQVSSMSAVVANLTSTPALQQFTMGLFGEAGKLYLNSDTSGFGNVGFHVKGIY